MAVKVIQGIDKAIFVMRDAGKWLEETGKKPSKWWRLENLNRKFLLQYAKPQEFYVAQVDGKPAAVAILQFSQNAQDWQSVDKGKPRKALYIHWLCVHRDFRGKNMPKVMVDFAEQLAKEKGVEFIRADTNAEETKLRKIYEDLGFRLVAVEQEDYRKTAFYQKRVDG